jgi:flagellar biosynthesis protein
MDDDVRIAVALKYEQERDGAPCVIAKGMHFNAEKIRNIAKHHGIPLMRNVSLASALYRVEVGQEIPEELYDAVAEILNFVDALQREEHGRRAQRIR